MEKEEKGRLHKALQRFRENGGVLAYMTPEKVATLAYNSSKVEGVDCDYEVLLTYARELMRDK